MTSKRETLQLLITRQVTPGSVVCSDTWRAYTGIASREFVHRLVNHGEKQYSDGKGNHINGLEGFWGYLKTKTCVQRRKPTGQTTFYLGEYVWRYNHRKESDIMKVRRILKLLEQEVGG